MDRLICVTDSDFLIAQVMKSDLHHQKALKVSQILKEKQAIILYPATAILETATTIQRKYNNSRLAQAVLDTYKDKEYQVIVVDQGAVASTANNFNPRGSKQNTPFDCLVVALAKNYKADMILGFDKFFQKKGFKTPQDLLNS